MSAGYALLPMENPKTVLLSPLHSILQTLRFTFVIVPIVAGLDKFTIFSRIGLIIFPSYCRHLPVAPEAFM
jgi:hypothetical protein